MSLESYYAHVGYLTQEPSIFDGTVEENLLYALEEVDLVVGARDDSVDFDERLSVAIRQSCCEFVYDLPQ